VIALGAEVLDRLGVLPRTELQLNTLGDTDSRKAYRTALVEYFSDHHMTLSEDSRDRLQRNPLRILDSKDQGDRRLIEDAPLFGDYLNAESQDFFATVQEALRALGIAFTVSPRLVRGLDYYCHTAFEFVTTELGAQGAVLAGGRYDGLVETMGGPPTPGTGWAAGIERLALMIAEPPPPPRPIAVVPVGPAATTAALQVAGTLRHAGLATELALASNLKRGLARANKIGARAAVLIGEDELARHAATVRDLDSGTQSVVRLDDLATHLAAQS
jgi:histidyl-tRNA synthetase